MYIDFYSLADAFLDLCRANSYSSRNRKLVQTAAAARFPAEVVKSSGLSSFDGLTIASEAMAAWERAQKGWRILQGISLNFRRSDRTGSFRKQLDAKSR